VVTQIVFPDVEPAIVTYLAGAAPSVHSCIELPPAEEFNTLLPVAQITRIGGPAGAGTWSDGHLVDRPTIDVDVYAGSRQAANEAVATLRAAFGSIKGATEGGAGFVSYRENAGPTFRPDASQNITRIGFTADLTVRPIAP
jgi:hypothetical protein